MSYGHSPARPCQRRQTLILPPPPTSIGTEHSCARSPGSTATAVRRRAPASGGAWPGWGADNRAASGEGWPWPVGVRETRARRGAAPTSHVRTPGRAPRPAGHLTGEARAIGGQLTGSGDTCECRAGPRSTSPMFPDTESGPRTVSWLPVPDQTLTKAAQSAGTTPSEWTTHVCEEKPLVLRSDAPSGISRHIVARRSKSYPAATSCASAAIRRRRRSRIRPWPPTRASSAA